ncbi:hypothetical protein [Colwellia piezophila]|uniref:hypothetical protein n=1 Tax=Colwellia piezophila TaxID=211668 RepID=UPI00035EB92D|nr:hypothetical protein [Colwellia piezophila]
MKTLLFISVMLVYTGHLPAYAEQAPWQLWKKNSLQSVSFRPVLLAKNPIDNSVDKPLIEIKATVTVNSSIAGFLLFMENVSNTPNWLSNASESELLEQFSISESIFYVKIDHIWPLSPRILILHSTYRQNEDLSVDIFIRDAVLEVGGSAKTLKIENLARFLRVKIHSAYWKITPKLALGKDGQKNINNLLIEYHVIADGRGDIPKWLADHLALKSIWQTMGNIRQQLPAQKWQQQSINGITELIKTPKAPLKK